MKKKLFLLPAALLLVVGILAAGWICLRTSATIHEADITADDHQYRADFTALDTRLEHTLPVAEGEELKCSWKIASGNADLVIRYEDGTKMYQGNHLDQAEFTLVAEQSGTCTITLSGWNAAGWISIIKS